MLKVSLCRRCLLMPRVVPLRCGAHSNASLFSPLVQKKRAPLPPKSARWSPAYKKDSPAPHTRHNTTPIRTQFTAAEVQKTLYERIDSWASSPATLSLLLTIGVPGNSLPNLLSSFAPIAKNELHESKTPLPIHWDIDHLTPHIYLESFRTALDKLIMSRFFLHVASPSSDGTPSPLAHLATVRSACDLRYPSEMFPRARALPRKIILHVGPTNSGKTHNALVRLAGAQTGMYAGPLRLLAHEVWERLNKGAIAPAQPDPNTGLDMLPSASSSVPRVSRECNLVTGEERRIVSADAGLISCTVEMVALNSRYQVAVIDEIQMIADPERGGAWTTALLGLNAEEIHLCGEETVVPLIQRILEGTGDEIVVNRYERLTPLVVSPESLDGDLSKVRKGDCVVTFSRNGIFGLKERIEKITGLRCAVAYGRLPPEVRSEQAHLFNDENSGFDVMVASDAIGMGLNLYVFSLSLDTHFH